MESLGVLVLGFVVVWALPSLRVYGSSLGALLGVLVLGGLFWLYVGGTLHHRGYGAGFSVSFRAHYYVDGIGASMTKEFTAFYSFDGDFVIFDGISESILLMRTDLTVIADTRSCGRTFHCHR